MPRTVRFPEGIGGKSKEKAAAIMSSLLALDQAACYRALGRLHSCVIRPDWHGALSCMQSLVGDGALVSQQEEVLQLGIDGMTIEIEVVKQPTSDSHRDDDQKFNLGFSFPDGEGQLGMMIYLLGVVTGKNRLTDLQVSTDRGDATSSTQALVTLAEDLNQGSQ